LHRDEEKRDAEHYERANECGEDPFLERASLGGGRATIATKAAIVATFVQ
jgi:hypothetical protein